MINSDHVYLNSIDVYGDFLSTAIDSKHLIKREKETDKQTSLPFKKTKTDKQTNKQTNKQNKKY